MYSQNIILKKNYEIYCRRKVVLFIEAEHMVHRVMVHIGDQTFFEGSMCSISKRQHRHHYE